jgi:hypothetical protein
MTAAKKILTSGPATAIAVRPESVERITVEDLKHKALAVRKVSTNEVKRVVGTSAVRAVLVGAAVVAVALSVAYYVGSRAGAKAAEARQAQ